MPALWCGVNALQDWRRGSGMDGADTDVPHLGFGVYGAASIVKGNTKLLLPTFDPARGTCLWRKLLCGLYDRVAADDCELSASLHETYLQSR